MKTALSLFIFCCGSLKAQMPDTEIWLFKLDKSKDGKYTPSKPINVSNRKGYDNQPWFSEDGKTLYYNTDQHKQAEVYTYKKQKQQRLTNSEESEYSPRPVAQTTLLSVVTVEKDSAQRLHFVSSLDGHFVKKVSTDSIGYYTFLNADTLIFYKLTEPHSLRWRTLSDSTEHFLAQKPIRGFATVSRHELIFGTRDSLSTTFYLYDFALRKGVTYAKKTPPADDVFWHPELGLLVSNGTVIERFLQPAGQWEKLADLSVFGLKKITRFAIDRKTKQLVVVDNPQ